jgi:hypothetical protein
LRKRPARPISEGSPLRFDFQKAARRAMKDHPELKKNGLFINAANDQYIALAPVFKKLEDDDEAQEDIAKNVKIAKRSKTSFFQAIPLDSKNEILTVVFHTDKHTLYDPSDKLIDDTGTFDHETGHALSTKAHGTLGENTADAYALLRHLQRYEHRKTDIDFCAWKRALIFMQAGVTSHLTTFTADKILIDSKTSKFVSLTPQQTIAVAKDYARKHTRDEKQLKSLAKAFSPLAKKPLNDATFKQLAKITLAAPVQSDVFYLGARVLLPPLENGPMMVDGKKIILTGKDWDRIRQQLHTKCQSLPEKHPLRLQRPLPPAA